MIKIRTKNTLRLLILFVAVFFGKMPVYSQNTSFLLENQQYDKVIERLVLKEASDKLSIKEYFMLSDAYVKTDNQYQSLLVLNKMINEVVDPNDIENLAIAYDRKAENLVDLSKIDEGVQFCDEMLPVLEVGKGLFFESFCVKCGILYDRARLHNKAFKVYNNVRQKEIRKSPTFINTYGAILMNIKKYDSAFVYLKEGLDLDYEANQLDHVNVGLTNLAKVLIEKEEWLKAKKYLDSSEASFQKKIVLADRNYWLETYYYFYLRQDKLTEARNVLSIIADYYSDIYDFKIQEKIKELEGINQRKIILDKKVTLLNDEIENTRKAKLIRFIILILLIIIITTWTLIIIYKNTELTYKDMVKRQEVLASQMTPHFIFNSLSILQGMVLNNEHEKASKYLSKFSYLLNPIVKDELHKFVPINEELILLENYVDLQNLSTTRNLSLLIDIEEYVKETILIPPMILQPFIENSIIHGFKKTIKEPEIRIQFTFIKKSLRCVIIDNGVGFLSSEKNEYENKTSLATKIVQDRFELLFVKTKKKPFIEIEDLGKHGAIGTQVILELPYIFKK